HRRARSTARAMRARRHLARGRRAVPHGPRQRPRGASPVAARLRHSRMKKSTFGFGKLRRVYLRIVGARGRRARPDIRELDWTLEREPDSDRGNPGVAAITIVAVPVDRLQPVAVRLELETAMNVPVRADGHRHEASSAEIPELRIVAGAELV